MTTHEIAQTMADAQGRDWWVVYSRGQEFATPNLGECICYSSILRITPKKHLNNGTAR